MRNLLPKDKCQHRYNYNLASSRLVTFCGIRNVKNTGEHRGKRLGSVAYKTAYGLRTHVLTVASHLDKLPSLDTYVVVCGPVKWRVGCA